MSVITSNEYDHIDVVAGSTTNRHYLKDNTARSDISVLKSAVGNITSTIVGNIDSKLDLYIPGENTYGIYWKSTGSTTAGQGKVCITGNIPITAGKEYTYSGLTSTGSAPHSVYLNTSKEFLSAFKQQTGTNTITPPSGAAYVSFSIIGDDDATFSFLSPIGLATKQEVGGVKDVLGFEEHTNLFDKTKVTTGNRLSTTGAFYSDTDYFVSTEIPVTAGARYAVNYAPSALTRICFYQSNGTFISKNDSEQTFTAPENCTKLRFCNLIAQLNYAKLYDLSTAPTSEVLSGIDTRIDERYISKLFNVAADNNYCFNLNDISYWENGTINTSGVNTDATNRIRTKDYVTGLGFDKFVCLSGYSIMPMYYNSDDSFAFYGPWAKERAGTSNYKIRLLLKKDDDSNIDVNIFGKVGFLKSPLASAAEQNALNTYIDNLCESRSKNEEIDIKAVFDAKVQKYIDDNGDGGKTFEQMREYLLNRNNCIYRGALTKSGTNVVDENGNVVELVGIGTHDLMDYSSLHTLQSLETLKYYGINCVRLTAYVGDHSMPKSAGDDGTSSKVSHGYISAPDETKAVMDDIITKCVSLGLYAIVDWHILAGDGNATQYSSEMKGFFTYFSDKYKNTDNVLYELMNEPHANTAAQVKSLLKECYDIIRANNETAVIVTGKCSDNMSDLYSALQSEGMTDVFMSEHFYWVAGSYSPTGAIQSYINAGYPLFITEWGNANGYGDGDTNDTYANDLMAICHSNDIGECVWKLTYQPMTTAVLRFSKLAMDGGYKYGWYNDAELSHNGKLYFHTFQNYLFES